MVWGLSPSAERKMARTDGNIDGNKLNSILKENTLDTANDLRVGWKKFVFSNNSINVFSINVKPKL